MRNGMPGGRQEALGREKVRDDTLRIGRRPDGAPNTARRSGNRWKNAAGRTRQEYQRQLRSLVNLGKTFIVHVSIMCTHQRYDWIR